MTINLLQATNSCSNGKFFYWTLSVQALDMLLNKEVSLRDIVTNFCILLLPKLDQYGKPAVVPDTDHNNAAHQQPPLYTLIHLELNVLYNQSGHWSMPPPLNSLVHARL